MGKQLEAALREAEKNSQTDEGKNSEHEVDQIKHKVCESHPIFLVLPGLHLKTTILFIEVHTKYIQKGQREIRFFLFQE